MKEFTNQELVSRVKTKEEAEKLIEQLQGMEFKKELPKSWDELGGIEGYFVNNCSEVVFGHSRSILGENIFKTEKQAKKALAMAKLSQLMHVYNDGWAPDWNDGDRKCCITRYDNDIIDCYLYGDYRFLTFKTPELRDEFMRNFEDDIRIYFELD